VIACAALFWLGLVWCEAFLTLALGVVVSMFTAIVVAPSCFWQLIASAAYKPELLSKPARIKEGRGAA